MRQLNSMYSFIHRIFDPIVTEINRLFRHGEFKNISKEYPKFIVAHLIETPIQFKPNNIKPIMIAISEGHSHILKYLLSLNCRLEVTDVDITGQNCLQLAVFKGHANIMNMLLDDIRKKDDLSISRFDQEGVLITIALKSLNIGDFNKLFKVNINL